MLNVKSLRNLIVLAAFVSVVLGIALLLVPSASILRGSADKSAAVTSALALIVATLGLVLALHMQSAEYRRETEVVDGLQELRVLLEIMTARCALDQMHGPVVHDAEAIEQSGWLQEKDLLLQLMHEMPGRFLIYFSAIKHAQAKVSQSSEAWRLLHLHVAYIRRAPTAAECRTHIVGLLQLVRQIRAEDISSHAKGFISADSIDALNAQEGNLVVDSMIRLYGQSTEGTDGGQSRRPPPDPFEDETALEHCISELQRLLTEDPDGAGALEELAGEFAKARAGDVEARQFLHQFHDALTQRRHEGADPQEGE